MSVASTFDFSSEVSTIKQVNDDDASAKSQRCASEVEVYKAKLHAERQRLERLDEQILAAETKALEQKRRAGGESSITLKEAKQETEKNILLERLNQKLVTLNTSISQKKKLRAKIDEARLQRCRYDEIYTKLERDTQRQSEQMAVVLEQGKQAIKRKDRATQELEALTKQLEESRVALKQEQEEVRRLEEFVQKADAQVDTERRKASRPIGALAVSQTLASEKTASREEEYEDDERALDEALAKVFELTGIDDVDLLIERLVQSEDLRLSLFTSISELEAQAAENETKISDAKQELERAKRCGVNKNTQTQKDLASMAEKRRLLEEKIKGVEAEHESQLSVWNGLKERISDVHSELGLELEEDLVKDSAVNEGNVLKYLAAIERKASEILAAVNGSFEDEDAPLSPVSNIGPLVKTTVLDLPSATTEENAGLGADDGERPLSMRELQESLKVSA